MFFSNTINIPLGVNLNLLFMHHSSARMHVKMLFSSFKLFNIILVCLSHSWAITRTANDRAINHPQAKVQALTGNKYSVVCVNPIMIWQSEGLRENAQFTVHTHTVWKHLYWWLILEKSPTGALLVTSYWNYNRKRGLFLKTANIKCLNSQPQSHKYFNV